MASIRRLAPALVAALLLPALLQAADFVIYTKDGQRILAREKPVQQGNRLIFRTPLGAQQSMAVDDFDPVRTEAANKEGLGGAYVLGDTKQATPIADTAGKKPSLSEYIRQNKGIMKAPSAEAPTRESTGSVGDILSVGPKSPDGGGGFGVDLQMMNAFMQSFEGAGLRGVRLTSIPQGVQLRVITETEQQVFGAIAAAARGLKESRALGKPLDKVDMYLATSAGESAGRFEISPEDAESLVTGRTTPSKFFIQHVIF